MPNEWALILSRYGAASVRTRASATSSSIRSGYGGSCFPKGVRALIHMARSAGQQASLLDAVEQAKRLYGGWADLELCDGPKAAVMGADVVVICTEWKQFRVVDLARLKRTPGFPVVVNGRNLWDPIDVRAAGLLYFAVGRGDSLRNDIIVSRHDRDEAAMS